MSAPAPLRTDDFHRIVLLYLSVAYAADDNFDDAEHHTVLGLVCQWMPSLSLTEAHGIVDTALKALQGGMTETPETLARTVGTLLTPKQRRRVLADLGLVARADGFLTVQEGRIIRRVRAALEAPGPGADDA